MELIAAAEAVAQDDLGVAMAPPMVFPAMSDPGVITVVTDASRAEADDGLGGYAVRFGAEANTVFVMSHSWPVEVKRALDAATVRRSQRPREDEGGGTARIRRLSMPAAETLAAVALATAVAAQRGGETSAVIAIGDCAPAAAALGALYSGAPQLRYLTGIAARVTKRWLGVAVPREINTVADLLSHPSEAQRVIAEFRHRGFEVVRVLIPPELWDAALEASGLPLGGEDSREEELDAFAHVHAINPLPC